MPTVHLANNKSFDSPAGVSILDAARHAGIVLEHSCKTGRCGTCRARVGSGAVFPLKPDMSLTQAERTTGLALTCVNAAVDDLRLEIEDLAIPAGIVVRTLPCRINALRRLAADVVEVELRLPPNARFGYLPGQYVNVIGRDGMRRSYSIANAPTASGHLSLHIRKVDQGAMSEYWFGPAAIGDLLRLEGPLGTFFLRPLADRDLIFLATGTGIAPIKAMLTELAARPAAERPRSTSLFWGGRTNTDLYWDPLNSGLDELRYTAVLSRADASWHGARGHVQDVLVGQRPSWPDVLVYACGLPSMIDSAKSALERRGVAGKQFFSDAFVSST